MSSQKHTILHLSTTIFLVILSINSTKSQENLPSSKHFDTTGLVIRVCIGDLPGQKKELGRDYNPVVCAYTYKNSKLNRYKVNGFDLIYRNVENGLTETVSGKNDRLSTEMKRLLNTADSSTLKYFFIDNVHLSNNKGEKMLITGVRPFWPTI